MSQASAVDMSNTEKWQSLDAHHVHPFTNPADLKNAGSDGDFVRDKQKYPTILTVDAKRLLGHYVALEILPEVIKTTQRFGYAKAYNRNSTHFGNCGIYSEMIAEKDLAAKVSCIQWAFPVTTVASNNSKRLQRQKTRRPYRACRFGWPGLVIAIRHAFQGIRHK